MLIYKSNNETICYNRLDILILFRFSIASRYVSLYEEGHGFPRKFSRNPSPI